MTSPPTTVLLIDPNKKDREYWAQRLNISSPDYVILEAETGKAGLAICRSQRVDCAIFELTLPDLSGFELLVNLVPRAYRPEIAVIILTRLVIHPMKKLALKNGAHAYMVKSQVSGDDLDQAIHKAVAAVGPNTERHS